MNLVTKATSMFFRFMELVSAAIVTGIVGDYVRHLHDDTGAHPGPRITYAIAMGSISLFFSLVLFPPFSYSFWAFPLDFCLFILWLVVFGLLEARGAGHDCSSNWFYNNWDLYWGGSGACGEWRAVLAWSFIGCMFWLASGLLGMYMTFKGNDSSNTWTTARMRREKPGRAGNKQNMTNNQQTV